MKHSMNRYVLCTIVGIGFAGGSNLLFAQQQPPQPPPPQQQQPAPPPVPDQRSIDVSDADLRKFAQIYVDVEDTRNELSQEMGEAENQQEAQEIQARMHEEIVSTIQDQGWSLNRYNEVANAITNDPELRQQAIELIERIGAG